MDWNTYAPNPSLREKWANPKLTALEARGLRHMYLSTTGSWDVLLYQTVQDKFGARGFQMIDRLVAKGVLARERNYWVITDRGKRAFQAYVDRHGMPRRRY